MRKLYLGTITLFFILSVCSLRADIFLTEIMPCNVSTVKNSDQNYTGWAEIYNNGAQDVNLKGYTFEHIFANADNPQKRDTLKWTVTNDTVKVKAGEYRLIFFDDNEKNRPDHANFKMETAGGCLVLCGNGKEKLRDSMLCYEKDMLAHISWGKYEGGEPGYMNPSPQKANTRTFPSTATRVTKPAFGTTTPGFYDNEVRVSLNSESGAIIYYTTDGSEPTEKSTKYEGEIVISKTTVIRARAYNPDKMLSDIVAGTYIFPTDSKGNDYHSSCNGFTVPVVSISTDPKNFFDDTIGIYIKGKNGIAGPSCDPGPANYQQDWKRPIHFEFFENEIVNGKPVMKQVVSQELDAAVMGGCSRRNTQKSLKINASNKLGNNKIAGLDGSLYDFFPWDKIEKDYKSVMLRNGGNDYSGSRVRDAFMQSIAVDRMNVDYQTHRPVAFYINGEYWGHMTMMIRHNKDYVYTEYGLKDQDIDVLEMSSTGVMESEGDRAAYDKMIDESGVNPGADDYYDRMNKLMDIDEYIDYQIFEQFIGNTDWPANNSKLWREKNTGRFRWIIVDTDFGFGLYPDETDNFGNVYHNMINWSLGKGPTNWANDEPWKVALFSNLMKNEKFRQRFLNRYLLHLGTTFVPERVTDILDKVINDSKNEICAHRARFSTSEWISYPSLESEKEKMSNFAKRRPEYVYDHLKSEYKLESLVDLAISANIPDADFIMNGERLNTSEFNGKYYKELDLNVQPVAPAGYEFVSWNQSFGIKILDSSTDWKYYYAGNQPEGNWIENSYNDSEWKLGKGKFGYSNDGNYDVELDYGDDSGNKFITAYFRTSFNLENLSEINDIQASIIYDDGFVIYINGKEIKRSDKMPEGVISYETLALDYENDAEITFAIDKQLLQVGTNVIAVEVHQNDAASSDLTFKFNLDAKTNSTGSSSNKAFVGKITDNINLEATFRAVDKYTPPALFINELCASNGPKLGFHDGYGVYGDWIEIYNAEEVPVDLGGMYLEIIKKNNEKTTYQFPSYYPFETTVEAKGYKIVWASKLMAQGPMHANFKLTAGEKASLTLYLMAGNERKVIDQINEFQIGTRNESYGRLPDGSSNWSFFEYCADFEKYLATPQRPNGSEECAPEVSVEEIFSAGSTVAMKLYPNPAKALLNVAVNTSDTYSIWVYDDKGRQIEYIPAVNEDVAMLNVQQYASGVYIVRVVTSETVLQQKFIKY